MYRRWSSREDLLIDAIRRVDISTVIDGLQDVRAVCAALLKSNLEWWGAVGCDENVHLRLQSSTRVLAPADFIVAIYPRPPVVGPGRRRSPCSRRPRLAAKYRLDRRASMLAGGAVWHADDQDGGQYRC